MTTIEPSGRTETRTVRIPNLLGLHARPAAEVVKLASRFASEILLAKADLEVNGKSIMGVMMLAAECGSDLRISASEHIQFRPPGHRTVIIEDLTNDTRRRQVGETRQVHRGFRLPNALQHSPGLRPQRKNMSGAKQMIRPTRGIHSDLNRSRPIGGTNSRGHALLQNRIDGDGERRAVRILSATIRH